MSYLSRPGWQRRLAVTTLSLACLSAYPAWVHAQADRAAVSIPAQSLTDALAALGRQFNLQILYPQDVVGTLRTAGVSGQLTPTEALDALLKPTGIRYQIEGNRVTLLPRAAQGGAGEVSLAKVSVTAAAESAGGGYVARAADAGTKTDAPIIETPQSISVVTRDRLDDQAAQRVQDALRYVAGVRTDPAFDTRYETMIIRGFDEARNGLYLNGLRLPPANGGNSAWEIEAYSLDRVEVLRGPASVLYGQNSPGGIVNMVGKRPNGQTFREAEFQIGNHDRYQAALDVGGQFDAEGTVQYRLGALARDSKTQTDYVEDKRLMLAPSLTWKPAAGTSLTVYALAQADRTGSGINFLPASGTLLPNPNGSIPISRFTGEPGFDGYDRHQSLVGYAFEQRIDDAWTFRQNLRYGHMDIDYQSVYAAGYSDAALRTLRRFYGLIDESTNALTVDNQLVAKFRHGDVSHTVLGGIDYQRTRFRRDSGAGLAPALDAFDPVYGTPFPTAFSTRSDQDSSQAGLYLQDQLKINERLVLLVGGRQDHAWSDSDTTDLASGATGRTPQNDKHFSGRVGGVYLFDNGFAPYASYSESFLPSSGAGFDGSPFEPTTGRQYELGLKFQPKGSNSFFQMAVFDIRQQNMLTPDPDTTHLCGGVRCQVQTGEIRSRGVELEGVAAVTPALNLVASYSYTDAEVTKSNGPDLDKRPVYVPEDMASLWAHYRFGESVAPGLSVNGGVRYIGKTYDYLNLLTVPGFTLVDVGLAYRTGSYRFGLNATNLFDKKYVASCDNASFCYYGNGRTVLGTMTVYW